MQGTLTKDDTAEFAIDPLFFLIKDTKLQTIRYGRLNPVPRPDSIEEQFQYLLGEFKKEGSNKADLQITFVAKNKVIPEILALLKESRRFGLNIKAIHATSPMISKVKLSLATGDLWIQKSTDPTIKKEMISDESHKTKVLIVEDSPSVQKVLQKIYSQMPGVQVVGVEASVSGAVSVLQKHIVDFISLDMNLEDGTGVDFLVQSNFKEYARKNNSKCILITDCSQNEGNLVFEAMAQGASSYFQKPQAAALSEFGRELHELISDIFSKGASPSGMINSRKLGQIDLRKYGLIAIGSSTGGTEVVADIIAGLPIDAPPIVVVQHMPAQFTGLYAGRLSRQIGKEVHEVKESMDLVSGTAYIAAGGIHMEIEKKGGKLQAVPKSGEPVNRFKPSVSVLFKSIVDSNLADQSIAIMLTGMGQDGAAEMLTLKEKGAVTIGQSKETCAVYGMPRAAEEIGALMYSASPEEIIRSFNRDIIKKAF